MSHPLLNRLTAILFLVFCGIAEASITKIDSSSLNQKIQNYLEKASTQYRLPALSISIKLPNETEIRNFVSGNYSFEDKQKITSETLFQMGSITKTFTSTIIFKLIEEKKLNMNDSITKWLPEYPKWSNITIKNLLIHTSGIYNYTSGKDFDEMLRKNTQNKFSFPQLIDIAYHHKNLAKPNKKFIYSNTDYLLLGMIIEKITQKSLQMVFKEYFQQYQLNNTFYSPFSFAKPIIKRLAHGYNRDGTFDLNTDVTFYSLSFTQSAGAIISTPNDLIKWLQLLFSGKIISVDSLSNMTHIISVKTAKPVDLKEIPASMQSSNLFSEIGSGAGIGLVYFKDEGLFWVHSGGTLGYESLYIYNPNSGVYLTLAYSVKPKEQLVFIKIAENILKLLR